MDKIHFNFYSSESSVKSQVTSIFNNFGDKAEVGEFSTKNGCETDADGDQDLWCSQIARLIGILEGVGVKVAYAFEWRTSSTTNYGFGYLKRNGVYPDDVNIAIQALRDPSARRFLTT